MSSICASARPAPRAPSSRSVSSRARRERTSAYSPMTKNALRAMSSAVATSSSAVIAERRVSRYFEGDRRARAVRGRRLAAASRGTEAVARRGLPLFVAMRIVSLVPHATELLFALGLGDDVVAVTHECDFPSQTSRLPTVTRDALPPGLSAGEIDAAVRERTERGQAIYELDKRALAELEPDLIVTQELCAVCAVSYDDVRKVAETLPSYPRVIALDPTTLGESMGDIRTIAQATGARDAGGLGRMARARGLALVHTNTSTTLGGAAAARVAGVPHVWHVREIYAGYERWWPAYRRLLLTAHAMPCVSRATCAQFEGAPAAFTLYDALTHEPRGTDPAAARRALGLPPDAVVAALVARVSGWKGQDLLVRALAEPALAARPRVVALLAGAPRRGEERHRRELHELAAQLGVTARVHDAGFQPDLDAVYAAADVVATASTHPDPLPNPLLEPGPRGGGRGGEVGRGAAQPPAEQPPPGPADRDVRDHERQDEVEDDQHPDLGLERVDAPRAQLDRRGAHQAEHRP